MTLRTRLDGRARSAAAALLAAVAVLGSLLAGPSVTAQASRLGSVAGSPVARAAAASGLGTREHQGARAGARPPSRRGQRDQSAAEGSGRFVVGTVLRSALGHGTAPLSGATAAAVLLGALVAVGLARAGHAAPRRRRPPAARRDRAPPAPALG